MEEYIRDIIPTLYPFINVINEDLRRKYDNGQLGNSL